MAKQRAKKPRIPKRVAETALIERRKNLAVIAMFKRGLGPYYLAIVNRIESGEDPRDPEYMVGRLMP